jgi:hypothetical protein
MNVLIAVIDDLYSFAVSSLFRLVSVPRHAEESRDIENDAQLLHTGSQESTVNTSTAVADEMPQTFRSVEEIFEGGVEVGERAEKNTLMYIGGGDTPVYLQPTREFDSVVTRLPYGAMVMALEQRGRWTRIAYNTTEGWVLREDLMDRAAHVYPHFLIGEQNTAHDPNTMRVRAMLDDMFAGGAAELDLQSSEYVAYRLMRKGLSIAWPETRPRIPGLWHTLLKGVPGIHISVSPKTGAVMEYMYSEDRGHLAYVEAVFPDETINISEVNYPDRGIYNERVLTRQEWRELKPLFIQVT